MCSISSLTVFLTNSPDHDAALEHSVNSRSGQRAALFVYASNCVQGPGAAGPSLAPGTEQGTSLFPKPRENSLCSDSSTGGSDSALSCNTAKQDIMYGVRRSRSLHALPFQISIPAEIDRDS